jgi:acyl-CoA synthetase (AMP-forming)/AMP-acid ligase II
MTLNLAAMFAAVAAAVPDRPAVSCLEQTLTYAELDARGNQLARHLVAAGIEPGQHVGLYMLNGVEYVESLLGCLKARAIPVNVNYRYTEHELSYLFNDAGLDALIVDAGFAPRAASVAPDVAGLEHVLVVGEDPTGPAVQWPAGVRATGYRQALDAEDGATAPRTDLSEDDIFMLYTGGTTGMPKGVMWRHEDFHHAALMGGNPYGAPHRSIEELVAGLESGPALANLITMPLMHGAASFMLFMNLFTGSHVVLLRTYDAVQVLREVERHKVQVVGMVGDAQMRPFVDALRAHGQEHDLSSLVRVGSGGAILSPSTQDDLRELLPDVTVRNSFGASESGADGVIVTGEDGIMRLQTSAAVLVVNDRLEPVQRGSGELGTLARSGHVPLGYHNDPEKTARTFPVIDGVRWAILGDLAEVDHDGSIIVHGRGSGCINTGGEKVFPEEVEQALLAHPAVMDALVAGVPDPTYGHRVAAAVQLRTGPDVQAVGSEDLRTWCRQRIAGYKVPAHIEIVEHVVRSPTGKADYRWARRVLEDGVKVR